MKFLNIANIFTDDLSKFDNLSDGLEYLHIVFSYSSLLTYFKKNPYSLSNLPKILKNFVLTISKRYIYDSILIIKKIKFPFGCILTLKDDDLQEYKLN